jgi:hypothetical protein
MKKTAVLLFSLAAQFAYSQCNCSGSSTSLPVGETGGPALVLTKGQWLAEAGAELRDLDETVIQSTGHHHQSTDPGLMNMLDHSLLFTAGMRVGITGRITLAAAMPYIVLDGTTGSTYGIGDLSLTGTLQLVKRKRAAFALIAGMKFPTGVRSAFGTGTNMIIGTGSFDPLAGISFSLSKGKGYMRGAALYKFSTTGYDGINYGSFLQHSLSYNYPVAGKNSCPADSLVSSSFSCTLAAGVNGEWMGQEFSGPGAYIANTGGYLLYAQGAVYLGFKKWTIPLSFCIPLMQAYNGTQSNTVFRAKIGLLKTF